jgi:hypothetical protein
MTDWLPFPSPLLAIPAVLLFRRAGRGTVLGFEDFATGVA